MAYEFLSDEWFNAVKELPAPPPPPALADLVVNVVVTSEGGDKAFHIAGGKFDQGNVDDAKVTISMPADVAKAMFVTQDQAVAMQAFMGGKVKVTGDMTRLMAMGQQQPTPEQQKFNEQIRELTQL